MAYDRLHAVTESTTAICVGPDLLANNLEQITPLLEVAFMDADGATFRRLQEIVGRLGAIAERANMLAELD